MNLLHLAAVFVALWQSGLSVPSPVQHRAGRSWEAEACSSRNLRNQDRYICTQDGKIQCLDGWIGDLCQVPRCGAECDPQHGYCVKPGECKCNLGYHGPSCRDCVKLPGCQNGYCKKSFECRCETGWSGMFCNTPECDQDCERNNGFCAGPGQCECKRGYSGPNCSECSTLPGCVHGSCTKPLECICDEGWTGTFCNEPLCAANCSREYGTCYRPGECRCKVGYQGEGCEQCVAYPGCVNGDCAEPYDCNCRAGWTGHLCDQPEVEEFGPGVRGGRCQPAGAFVCMNGGEASCHYYGNGSLVGQPECRCKAGYGGTWCEESIQSIEPRNPVTSEPDSIEASAADTIRDATEDPTADSQLVSKNTDGSKDNGSENRISEKDDRQVENANDANSGSEVTTKSENIPEVQNTSRQIKDVVKEATTITTTTTTTEHTVTTGDVDWSNKSGDSKTTIEHKSESSEQTSVSSDVKKTEEDVSELGVRAIHSDVFNSGKLIENFGSEEGLQSFRDY